MIVKRNHTLIIIEPKLLIHILNRIHNGQRIPALVVLLALAFPLLLQLQALVPLFAAADDNHQLLRPP